MCFIYKGVSFGGSKNSAQPQCTGVKEKIILLVWLRNPKSRSEQSTGKMTVTTMGYSRCWGLLENGALQTPINTQIHPWISFAFNPSLRKSHREDKGNRAAFYNVTIDLQCAFDCLATAPPFERISKKVGQEPSPKICVRLFEWNVEVFLVERWSRHQLISISSSNQQSHLNKWPITFNQDNEVVFTVMAHFPTVPGERYHFVLIDFFLRHSSLFLVLF